MNNAPKLWLLLNGDCAPPITLPAADDIIIAVDGGIRHTQTLGITATIWIGDFDSFHPTDHPLSSLPTTIHRYPTDKDQTDFELALTYAASHYPNHHRHIIGSDGNEPDHAFGNLWILPQSTAPCVLYQPNATIIGGYGDICLQWQTTADAQISLFALTEMHGIHNQGLKWLVHNATLKPHTALAARNQMAATTANISWQTGYGLLYLPPNTAPQIHTT